jgi:tripartite-type tricarboxylate transporter receptor subunit TctC
MITKRLALIGAAVALVAGAFSAQAQDFPIKDKPISIVVPFAAGGLLL